MRIPESPMSARRPASVPFLASALAALALATGCSSSSTSSFNAGDGGNGPNDAATSSGDSGGYGNLGNDAGSAPDALVGGDDASLPTDSQCHMLAQAACVDCCGTAHPAAFAAFTAAYMACACTPSACQTQCAISYCANPPSSPASTDPCGMCLYDALYETTGACYGPVNQACATGSTCWPYVVCAVGDGTPANTGCQ